eukprot:jgi/Mesvir1/28411/Mv25878-RA.1
MSMLRTNQKSTVHVGYTTFCKHMPACVKGRWKMRNLCACQHHTTMQSMVGGLAKFRATFHARCECGPECHACDHGSQLDVGSSVPTCSIFKATHTTEWVNKFTCEVEGMREGGGSRSSVGSSRPQVQPFQGELEDLPMHGRVLDDEEGVPDHDLGEELGVCSIRRKACVLGTCRAPKCGIRNFMLCEREEASNHLISWTRYEMQDVPPGAVLGPEDDCDEIAKAGGQRLTQVDVKSTPTELKEAIVDKWPDFIQHCFNAWWQADASKECLSRMRVGDLVCHTDYAENYQSYTYHNLQAQYWHPVTFVLMPWIVRYLDPASGKVVRREFHFIGQGGMKRDGRALRFAILKILATLRSEGVEVKRFIGWSDNCSMQFKSRNVIAEVARLLTEDPHLESFEWNYFGEQHGKGEVDGAGGTVKCMLRRWHIREENQDKQTAAQLVENLASGAVGGTTTTRRNFFEFPEVLPYSPGRGKIKGVKKAHWWRMDKSNVTRLMLRQYSCYCGGACAEERWWDCRKEWTDMDGWNVGGARMKLHKLGEPVQRNPNGQGGHAGTRLNRLQAERTMMGRRLKLRDIFAVESYSGDESHDPDHPYWLAEVLQEPYQVAATFVRRVADRNGKVDRELFRKGQWVVGVRYWDRFPGMATMFKMDADAQAEQPNLVNCYLCMDAGFEHTIVVNPANNRQAILTIPTDVEKRLTNLAKKRPVQ